MAIDTILTAADARTARSFSNVLFRAWLAYRTASLKRRTRHSLLDLTEEQLCDIGISHSDAQREVRKSFYWD